MFVNYENLKKAIIDTNVPKPLSSTLSGHAAGEPFDKHVYAEIKTILIQTQNAPFSISKQLKTERFNISKIENLPKRG